MKKRKLVILIFVAAMALVILSLLWFKYRKPATDTYYPKASPNTAISQSSASPTPSKEKQQQNQTPVPIPTSAAPTQSQSGSITIDSPTRGGTVTSETTVVGKAQVAGGKIEFRLKGRSSGVLASGSVQVSGSTAQPAPFSFALGFTNNVCDNNKTCGQGATDTGVLEVFSYSPKDGSEINIASTAVNIKG